MTNEDLDKLTEMAADIFQNLTPVMLGGNGKFCGIGGEVIQPAELLEWHYRASQRAAELHAALLKAPRRKMPTKV